MRGFGDLKSKKPRALVQVPHTFRYVYVPVRLAHAALRIAETSRTSLILSETSTPPVSSTAL